MGDNIDSLIIGLQNITLSGYCNCSICAWSVNRVSQPWNGKVFKWGEALQDPVSKDRFQLPPEYKYKKYGKVVIDLNKVLANLPHVISCIKEHSSPYMELANYLQTQNLGTISPYAREIKMYPYNMAFYATFRSSQVYTIDCEYMISISLPNNDLYMKLNCVIQSKIFNLDSLYVNENRWIFIPSSDRCENENIILDRSNIHFPMIQLGGDTFSFVVVRPNQFDCYRSRIGWKVPVIRLPENIIGVGYARYWIVKIAKRLKMKKIWMCDDSVDWFKEYIPANIGGIVTGKDPYGQCKVNLRCDKYCFKKMEGIMSSHNLAIIGPRVHSRWLSMKSEFTIKPPTGVVLLNIETIAEYNLNYRPELRYMEDMIFAAECKRAGLEVCVWNAIVFYDKHFRYTGVNTPNQS